MRLESATEYVEVDRDDLEITIRTGRLGTRGTTRIISATGETSALESYESALVDALRAGFQRRAGTPPNVALAVRDSPIERAVRIDRDDKDARAVYADWLQGQGNPAGEWIALALQRGARRDPKLEKRLTALEATLRLPLPDQAKLRWKLGMWRSVRIENQHDRRDGGMKAEPFRAAELARMLFEHPLCVAVEELTIGALNYQLNATLTPVVLVQAGAHAWAKELPSLVIGDCSADPDQAYYLSSYNGGALGIQIRDSFPGLKKLRVWKNRHAGGLTTELEGLKLPALEDLAIGGRVDVERLAELDAITVPNLERLELSIPSDVRASHLASILSGTRFPKLCHLALVNSTYTDVLVADIARSPLAERLVSLDVSMGMLTDDGAARLAGLRARLPALQHLVVEGNYLNGTHGDLRRAFKTVSATRQRYGVPVIAMAARMRRQVGP